VTGVPGEAGQEPKEGLSVTGQQPTSAQQYTEDGRCRGCAKPVQPAARALYPRYCPVPLGRVSPVKQAPAS